MTTDMVSTNAPGDAVAREAMVPATARRFRRSSITLIDVRVTGLVPGCPRSATTEGFPVGGVSGDG